MTNIYSAGEKNIKGLNKKLYDDIEKNIKKYSHKKFK